MIDPADDEINILLPIAFILFVSVILLFICLFYFLLRKFDVVQGKFWEKFFKIFFPK
jgi:hypothetical protein